MVDMAVIPGIVITTLVYGCQLGILSVALSLNYITNDVPNFALGARASCLLSSSYFHG